MDRSGIWRAIRRPTSAGVAGLVFGLILVMCMVSAGLAMRRLADADPAEIF
jgi:hypothetical protein